jgi:hypothetical protein
VKLGPLMETAERHQKLAEAAIGKLNEQAQGLVAVLRDQIRRAVVEEMTIVQAETQDMAALRSHGRSGPPTPLATERGSHHGTMLPSIQ